MNDNQRVVMFAVIGCMVAAFIYAPHAYFTQGSAHQMGFALIFDLPHTHSVHVPMLLAEWFGTLVVGGMLFYILNDGDKETSYSEEPRPEIATPATASPSKHLIREGYAQPASALPLVGSNGNGITPEKCPKCGYARTKNDDAQSWRCPACGIAYNKARLKPHKVPPTRLISRRPKRVTMGTKWLKFWNYFSLPVGGTSCLLIGISRPDKTWVIMVPIAIIYFVVAYGLDNRKIWAWKWNWGIIILSWLGATNPVGSSFDFWVKFVISGLMWMWPNYVYWIKRKTLFS